VLARQGDEIALRCYLQEKMVLTQLENKHNIVQLIEFVEVVSEPETGSNLQNREAFFLLEWCPGDSLLKLI